MTANDLAIHMVHVFAREVALQAAYDGRHPSLDWGDLGPFEQRAWKALATFVYDFVSRDVAAQGENRQLADLRERLERLETLVKSGGRDHA